MLTALVLISPQVLAEELPRAVVCYQSATNARDIDAYIGCFVDDALMIDVSREVEGQDAIRTWALREVVPHGDTFAHRRILEETPGYAKTEVNWLAWVVHYAYWWNDDGKITKMSLQYAD